MGVKNFTRVTLKKIGFFEKAKELRDKTKKRKRLTKRYKFENRMKNKNKVCFILAGYKPLLWDIVFKRIKTYIPDDIEVCILSSGKYIEELSNIAKGNDWSYLSTKRNNVSLIQNVAINLFKNAEFIYKIDEDIFITNGYFETMIKTLEECERKGEYQVGFVSPIIPINLFGYMKVLKKFDLIDKYTEQFGKPYYGNKEVWLNPQVAKFLWGGYGKMPNIDEMNDIVKKEEFKYSMSHMRLSISAILFRRSLWKDMGMISVTDDTGMGGDEWFICNYCSNEARAMIVSENNIVGHFSFSPQYSVMKEYFEEHKDLFDIHKIKNYK